jgi:hypothetical protein
MAKAEAMLSLTPLSRRKKLFTKERLRNVAAVRRGQRLNFGAIVRVAIASSSLDATSTGGRARVPARSVNREKPRKIPIFCA